MIFHLFLVLHLFHSTISSCPSSCHCSTRSRKSSLNCVAANLTNVPVIIGEKVNVVEVIMLDGNNLTKLFDYEFFNAGLRDLKKLSLRNCNIKMLPEKLFFSMTNLQVLNLSGNLLSALLPHLFYLLPALRSLDLSHNALSSIPKTTITSLSSSLSRLSLAGNILTSLPPSSFPLLSTLKQLDLSDNPWHCDCLLAGLHAQLTSTNGIPALTTCSRPLVLLDQDWSDLHTSDFVCRPVISVQQLVTSWPGHTASLQCNVTASHSTEVVWLDSDRIIHNNAHPSQDRDPHLYQRYSIRLTEHRSGEYISTFHSILSIQNISMTSAGVYSCLAWNKAGMEQKQVRINLEENTVGLVGVETSLVIIGVFAVVSILVIVLVIIIILCLWRKFKGSGRRSAGYNVTTSLSNSRSKSKLKVNPKPKPPRTGAYCIISPEDVPGNLSRNSTDQTLILAESPNGHSDIVRCSDTSHGGVVGSATSDVDSSGYASLSRTVSDQTGYLTLTRYGSGQAGKLGHLTTSCPQTQSLDYLDTLSTLVSNLPGSRASLGTLSSTTDQTYSCPQHPTHYPSPHVHRHLRSGYVTLPRSAQFKHPSHPTAVQLSPYQSAHYTPGLPAYSSPIHPMQQVAGNRKQQLRTITELE